MSTLMAMPKLRNFVRHFRDTESCSNWKDNNFHNQCLLTLYVEEDNTVKQAQSQVPEYCGELAPIGNCDDSNFLLGA